MPSTGRAAAGTTGFGRGEKINPAKKIGCNG
jgi:hypothetical protein